jgi:2-oxo-4-hydroxy-4-carboxy-5-ureidoimidazoline decarboxylase
VDLDTFNALTPAQAAEVLRPCADVESWIQVLIDGRPYGDLDALLGTAVSAAAGWGAAEVDAALAQHPRIGERHAGSEQSGITGEAAAIVAGNRAYEDRFGRIFLIRAAGRTSAEVLDQLRLRLGNDPETETQVVAGQLREIALLRLEGVLSR